MGTTVFARGRSRSGAQRRATVSARSRWPVKETLRVGGTRATGLSANAVIDVPAAHIWKGASVRVNAIGFDVRRLRIKAAGCVVQDTTVNGTGTYEARELLCNASGRRIAVTVSGLHPANIGASVTGATGRNGSEVSVESSVLMKTANIVAPFPAGGISYETATIPTASSRNAARVNVKTGTLSPYRLTF